MRSIQDVGTEILNNQPKDFYIFVGKEYGIKMKYIEILSKHFGSVIEFDSVSAVLNLMRTKHIIPLNPAVYVVRYDDEFISNLNDSTNNMISTTNICGTIVCIYEQSRHVSKLDKYLPNYVVSIDSVNSQYISKYLHTDFPSLNDRFIDVAIKSSSDYNQAKNICRCMKNAPIDDLYSLNDSEISRIFGHVNMYSESFIKKGIASRNFNYLMSVIDNYEGELDSIIYSILSTMIELDKCMDNSHIQSDIREYVKLWTREDVYHMFMNTYDTLVKIRTFSVSDIKGIIIYLVGLLQFNRIPSKEVMS